MNNLKELQYEKEKLRLKEKALKKILLQNTQMAVHTSKREILDRINAFNDWGQLGITALAVYQTFSQKNDSSATAASNNGHQQISDWLALASDVAKVIE